MFFSYHPKQDTNDSVVKKSFMRKDGSNRKWLTFSESKKALYCSVCLAFSKVSDTSTFIEGMTDRKHIHVRIEEHENSVLHRECADAYFLRSNMGDIENLLFSNQMSLRREQIRKRRNVMERIVNIVKLIGKRGLSYRGNKTEAAYTLADDSLDHGNFLELVLLLAKYDVCMQEHVSDCIEKSRILQSSGKKGRGSLVTMLSKNTVNAVIEALSQLIKEDIASANLLRAGLGIV